MPVRLLKSGRSGSSELSERMLVQRDRELFAGSLQPVDLGLTVIRERVIILGKRGLYASRRKGHREQ